MTEAEWLNYSDPLPMLAFLWRMRNKRKLRLFACACCRRVWHELTDERSRRAVLVAEQYADGLATAKELKTASAAAGKVCHADNERERGSPGWSEWDGLTFPSHYSAAACNVALPLGLWASGYTFVEPYRILLEGSPNREAEEAAQCVLVREIFGNPFCRVATDPAWLTSTVVSMAEGIYQEKAFNEMPILADALEEAGCTNADILNHCRQPGEHVRGCWVVDLLLGKD